MTHNIANEQEGNFFWRIPGILTSGKGEYGNKYYEKESSPEVVGLTMHN
jgi:hypothetical protein